MKKRLVILIILLIIFLLIIILSVFYFFTNDKDISFVTFKTNVNEIYEWKYDIENNKIIKFIEKKQFGDVDNKNGGNITEKYYFKALKTGKTNLTFTFTNTGNGSYLDTKYYLVKVDKKLRLTITEIKNE